MSTPGKGPFYGWIIVAVSFFIITIAFGTQYSFGVFFKPLQEEFGWTRAETSGVFSLYMFFHLTLAILTGWATDRFGPRILVAVGGFFTGLGLMLTSQITALWQLYITFGLIVGLGLSTAWNPLLTTVSRWFVQRRGLASGIVAAGVGTGTMLMAPLAGFLISTYDWRISYRIIGLMAWVVIITAALFLKKEPREIGALPYGETTTHTNKQDALPESASFSFWEALRTNTLWLLFLIHLCCATCLQMVMAHLVRYAEDVEISAIVAATFLSFVGGFSILGRIAMGGASDRIGRKTAFIICALLEAAMMFWLIKSTTPWMFYLFAVLFGFSYGGWVPLFPALTGEFFGLRHLGAIYGVILFAAALGGTIGPLLAGYLFDTTDSYSYAFLIGAIAMLLAVVFILLLKAPRRTLQE